MRQVIAVTQEVLDERGLVTFRKAIAPHPALFYVSGVDGKDGTFPFTSGETHPSVRCPSGRMGTAVHPDGAGLLVGGDVVFDGDDFLGLRILFVPEAALQGAAINVRRDVHL